jgi:hypothetical protein
VIYFGGGVNYWARSRLGLRIEYRHHRWGNADGSVQFAGIRFGVVFR